MPSAHDGDRPLLLVVIPLIDQSRTTLEASFDLVEATDDATLDDVLARRGERVRALLTNGAIGVDEATLARLPTLELIGALGVGHENVPLAAARSRGIVVTNGAGTNDDCVADHAFALLLAVVRQIPLLDRATRDGRWRDDLPLQPNFSGRKLGVLGLGGIGRKVARRGLAFDLAVGYHNRRPAADTPHRWFDSALALATWADYLVISTPGGTDTRHLVDAAVLEALGPSGYVVNVARGSVVDTAALASALERGTIAGAGLDVYEGEPSAPALLVASPRVVLTPHVGGRSPEAIAQSIALFVRNASLHFAGDAVLTPIH